VVRRAVLIVLGVVVVAGLVTGALVLTHRHGGSDARAAAPHEPVPATGIVVRGAGAGEQANIDQVSRLLTQLPGAFAKGDDSAVAHGGAAPSGSVTAALPAGARITPDTSTWHRTGAVASLNVTVVAPSGGRTDYLVILLDQSGQWRIDQTYPLGNS
jgi:hypothetical protein